MRTDSRLHELPPSDPIGSHASIPPPELELSSCTLQRSTITFRTPGHLLTLQHVVQSVSAAEAPAARCYSAEYHWGCDGQHAEGDVNVATGVRHPTDPTRGPEDPP